MSDSKLTKRQKKRKKIKIIKMIIFFTIVMIACLTGIRNLKISSQKNTDIMGNITETSSLKIENDENSELVLEKTTISYLEKSNQTVLSLDIKNNGKKVEDKEIALEIYNEKGKSLEEITTVLESLGKGDQTRINIVIDKDLRKSTKIKIR